MNPHTSTNFNPSQMCIWSIHLAVIACTLNASPNLYKWIEFLSLPLSEQYVEFYFINTFSTKWLVQFCR